MKVLELTAAEFIRPLSNGRTQPLLLGCENVKGERSEVVVKLRGREMTQKAQIVELVAAQLADDLGLDVPRAAVVEVPLGFEAVVGKPEAAAAIKASPGKHFGSVHLGQGFTSWPVGRAPHGIQRDQAAVIFAFDTLIQNPDRRMHNPNLWARSDRLGVFDHEQAFTFLYLPIIGGVSRPWHPGDQAALSRFLDEHVFRRNLQGKVFDLDDFEARLGALTDIQLQGYTASVPKEWQEGHDLCANITEYLTEARQERQKIVSFIKHLLR